MSLSTQKVSKLTATEIHGFFDQVSAEDQKDLDQFLTNVSFALNLIENF